MRALAREELVHERLAETFADHLSDYDTTRRVETLIDAFLGPERLAGRTALDVGCGLGFFSKRLVEHGAEVTACDLGPELVRRTASFAGCEALVADALDLEAAFGRDSFDVVVSSECIEHTPDPAAAVRSMIAVLRPGGLIALSTPNRVWYPVVRAATLLRLRPFDGYENFSSWRGLRGTFADAGVEVLEERGLHLFPFQFGLDGLSRAADRHLQGLRGAMINICLLGRKRA